MTGLAIKLIAKISFERIIIAALFGVVSSLMFFAVHQQSTINAMSEELSALRAIGTLKYATDPNALTDSQQMQLEASANYQAGGPAQWQPLQ